MKLQRTGKKITLFQHFIKNTYKTSVRSAEHEFCCSVGPVLECINRKMEKEKKKKTTRFVDSESKFYMEFLHGK